MRVDYRKAKGSLSLCITFVCIPFPPNWRSSSGYAKTNFEKPSGLRCRTIPLIFWYICSIQTSCKVSSARCVPPTSFPGQQDNGIGIITKHYSTCKGTDARGPYSPARFIPKSHVILLVHRWDDLPHSKLSQRRLPRSNQPAGSAGEAAAKLHNRAASQSTMLIQ